MKKLLKKRLNQKGFTLIELIVVIAILGILAAIAIPRLSGFTEQAKETNDEELAANIANAGAMYMAANPTDTSVTLSDLETADLIDSDLLDGEDFETDNLKSTRYENLVFTATTSTGVCKVDLKDSSGAVVYTISK